MKNKLRPFFMFSLIGALTLGCISAFFIVKVNDVESVYYTNMINHDSGYLSPRCTDCEAATALAGYSTLPFFLFFIAISSFLFLRSHSLKVLSAFSTLASIGMLIWDFVVIDNANSISFAEVGLVWILFAVLQVAISGINMVKLNKRSKLVPISIN